MRLSRLWTETVVKLEHTGTARVRCAAKPPHGVTFKVVLLPDVGDEVDCAPDASGVWTATNVPADRYRAVSHAAFSKSELGARSSRGWIRTAIGWWDAVAMDSVVHVSESFVVPPSGVGEVVIDPKFGVLRLRCEGDAERAAVTIASEDGRPCGFDPRGTLIPRYTMPASKAVASVPLRPGRYRVRLEDPDLVPFETVVAVAEVPGATLIVPTRLKD
jgi:hypothetical protein